MVHGNYGAQCFSIQLLFVYSQVGQNSLEKIKSAELGLCVFWPIEIGLHCSWRGAYEWKTATTRPHRVAGAFAPLSFWLGGHPLFRFLTKRMVSASEVFGLFFWLVGEGVLKRRGKMKPKTGYCALKNSQLLFHIHKTEFIFWFCWGPPTPCLFPTDRFVVYQNSLKCTHTHNRAHTIALSRSCTQN